MMFVLDTNVVSELRKVRIGKADANVTAWTESVDAADLFLSAITILELELGVLSIERKDATQGAMLRAWVERNVLPEFSGRTLPIDTAVAQRCDVIEAADTAGGLKSNVRVTLGQFTIELNVRAGQRAVT